MLKHISTLGFLTLLVIGCADDRGGSVRNAVSAALVSGDSEGLRRAIEDYGDICGAVDLAQEELAYRIGQAALAGNYSEAYVARVREVLRSFRELFGCRDPFTSYADGGSSDGGASDGGDAGASCRSFGDCTSCTYQSGCAWYPAYGCESAVYLNEHMGVTDPNQCFSGGGADGGADSGSDAGVPVVAGDFSCRGTRRLPWSQTRRVVGLRAIDLENSTSIAYADYQVFNGHSGTATCSTSDSSFCHHGVTDGAGGGSVELLSPAFFNTFVRVDSITRLDTLTHLNILSENDYGIALTSVSRSTVDTLFGFAGQTRDQSAGIVHGSLRDCSGNGVANARVRLFSGNTEIAVGAAPFASYFSGSIPSPGRTHTDASGTFVIGNVPLESAESRAITLVLSGRLSADGPEVTLSCENMHAIRNGVTLINPGPARGDYGPPESFCSYRLYQER